MLELLKLYKAFNLAFSLILILSLQACSPKDIEISQTDLRNPEKLVVALEAGISSERKQRAELFYQDAQEMIKQKRWGAAFKGFGESALNYPSAKALIGLSKASANSSFSNESDKGISRLKSIKEYLVSAIAVEEIRKQLPPNEAMELKNDIACIDQFIISAKKKDDCKYVNITLSTFKTNK